MTQELLPQGLNIIKEIEAYQPKLIVLDVQLGETDGRIIARMIKNSIRLKDIKIILTSAALNSETINEIPTEIYDKFIPKPFDIDDLIKTVKSLRKNTLTKYAIKAI